MRPYGRGHDSGRDHLTVGGDEQLGFGNRVEVGWAMAVGQEVDGLVGGAELRAETFLTFCSQERHGRYH